MFDGVLNMPVQAYLCDLFNAGKNQSKKYGRVTVVCRNHRGLPMERAI